MKSTIYYNGNIITMDPVLPNVPAVLVTGGIIRALGEKQDLLERDPQAQQFDLNGGTLLPGFIDAHSHITAVANQRLMANLNPSPIGSCNTVQEVVEVFRKQLKNMPPHGGRWLIGMGYDNAVFPGGKHPTRFDLDRVSTEVPIVAVHVSGHLCVANTKAMEQLGYLGEDVSIPAGGSVEESGLLKESAFLLPEKQALMRGPAPEEIVYSLGEASKWYASFGITTAQDARTGIEEYRLLQEAGKQGLLKNDVVMYFQNDAADLFLPHQPPQDNRYQNHCRAGGYKLFLDGSPQGKTAWLSAPYLEPPEGKGKDYRGIPLYLDDELQQIMLRCIQNHWQINVHANGDEAIEQMIRCWQKAYRASGVKENLRPVIIHCQTVRPDQLDRMKELKILPSYFLDHVYYWGDYHYESVLGPNRAEAISPLFSTWKRGIPFTMHQDSPVVPPNILGSIHHAVNRKTRKGRVLGESERISVREALKAVTVSAAYQIFEEARKGSITPEKVADFVLLDQNPLTTNPLELEKIKVRKTIKNGEVIYNSERS